MSADECPETILITSQKDVRDGALSPCKGDRGFTELTVRTDADTLGLTNFTGGFNITVISSPQLQVLSLPDLTALDHLYVSSAPSLTQISVPELQAAAEALVYPVTYTFTPSITVLDAGRFGGLSLPSLTALGDLEIRHVPRRQTVSGGLSDITAARSITVDNVLAYPGLASVGALDLTGYSGCVHSLPNLTRAGNFTYTNAVGSRLRTSPGLAVSGSFTLRAAPYRRAENETTTEFEAPGAAVDGDDVIDVRNLTSVGADATIRSNADARIDISGLATVAGALSVTNNTNCTIDATALAQVGSLAIVDNVDTTIPRLFNLARADSIHLRGLIDTSSGPNILPSLTFVSGTVSVEAWNADFNCSRLVSQQQQGLINNLRCNGTDNGTSSTTSGDSLSSPASSSSSSSSSQGISTGAWAGIGVGVGLVVLGLLGGAAWLVVHFRRRFAALEASTLQQQQRPDAPPDTDKHPDSDTTTTTTTTPLGDRAIYEADPTSGARVVAVAAAVPPVEKPADSISHEMYVLPAELPVDPPRPRRWDDRRKR
ncbi:hypothetical protein SAMD00023353_7200420 [Rosellinia necatrix]|uniref:Gpi-anchored cell wall organization protein ecm33 n=1 Tax=Rosellinia necatrix TaxID=77044 RepID=A0A1W2TTL9_ROSNE|nr:hypothetical protein SAMD00023353_7200420 [Rosellinia necatrix]